MPSSAGCALQPAFAGWVHPRACVLPGSSHTALACHLLLLGMQHSLETMSMCLACPWRKCFLLPSPQNVRVSSGDRVTVTQFLPPPSSFQVALLNAEVGFVSAKAAGRGPDMEIDAQVGGRLCYAAADRKPCLPWIAVAGGRAPSSQGPSYDAWRAPCPRALLPFALQDLSGHLAARFAGQVLTTGQELTFEYQVGPARLLAPPAASLRATCSMPASVGARRPARIRHAQA